MATKKSPTRAKTKTTKKTPSKTASASKAVSTKQSNAKATFIDQIKTLNVLGAFLSLALAAAAGFFMGHTSYQLFTGLLSKDELASKAITVFAPAIHLVYDAELRWAVVVIMVLSAIVPILVLSKYKDRYQANLAAKSNWLRWADTAVVSALIVEIIALLSGVQDIVVLKLIAGLVVITYALSWLAEKQNAGAKKPVWDIYIISLVTGLLPWVLIGVYAAGTVLYGLVRSPWYVYALYGVGLLGFAAYASNQRRQFKARQNYETTETNYLRINLYVRVAFAIILIIGLQK